MHDTFNTRGGQVGFEVICADGRTFREDQHLWDEIPEDAKVTCLRLVNFQSSPPHEYLRLADFERYFFSNTAVGQRGQGPMHAGKVLGGVRDGASAVEVTIEFGGPKPTLRQRECAVADLGFSSHAFRSA